MSEVDTPAPESGSGVRLRSPASGISDVRPLWTNHRINCDIDLYLSVSALSWEVVPLHVMDVMYCNAMYLCLSANSQGMLPRARGAQ